MIINAKLLRSKRACTEQVDVFIALFGEDGGEVTIDRCLSVADKFDWDWAAEHLLSPPARAEYDRVVSPAWAEYKRVKALAFAAASQTA